MRAKAWRRSASTRATPAAAGSAAKAGPSSRTTRILVAIAGVGLVLAATTVVAPWAAGPAQADSCPSASVGGRAVARIVLPSGVTVPVKPISYDNGGQLHPPPSARVAAISAQMARETISRGARAPRG